MIRSPRLRLVLASACTAALAACSSSGGGISQVGGMLSGLADGLFSDSDGAPAPPAKVDRSTAAKYQFASLGVTIDDNPQFLFLLANRNERDQLYTLGYSVSLVLRDGRLIRTQGFSRDVLGSRWEGQDIVRAALGASGPVAGVRWFESNERGIHTFEADCTAQDFGEETITVLQTSILTHHISEECLVPDMKWKFRNEFWIAPTTGQVWLSLQHIHPRINPILIETFRPAS